MHPFALRLVPLLSGLLALTGCTGADILNLTVPRSGYTLHHSLAYGSGPRQMLDVYVPDEQDTPSPVILFFYGGSWQSGSRNDYRFVGQALAKQGFIAVIADYRLYPEVHFPAFMSDAAQALAWTHAHIAEYGGSPSRITVAGHSAGAHIAVMLALNERYLREAGAEPEWIDRVIGIAGPYDFLPITSPDIRAVFSRVPDPESQPITFARPGAPPMLLATGELDDEVYPRNTAVLARRLREMGNAVEEKHYPGIGHLSIIVSLAHGFREKSPLLADIAEFVRR